MVDRRRALVLLLRVFGVTSLFALPAVFLPRSWMAAIHSAVGLGAFPEGPIVDYLARSLSVFYALIGGMLLVLSTDVERYRTVLLYVGWTSIGGGLFLLGIDLHAGMPPLWTLHEGPTAIAFGTAVVLLARPRVA